MNKCLHCGKEIAEGRKFCNHHCSASYNNVRRQRRPWSDELKKNHQSRVIQVCKYCGKPTGNFVQTARQFGTCSDCSPYIPKLKTIRALGWVEGPLREGYEQALQKMEEEYQNGESTATLSTKYGLDDIVFQKYLKHVVRSRSESRQNALLQGRSTVVCGPQYESGYHNSWEGKKFHYRSSWEKEFMQQLDLRKVRYEYEPFGIRYWDTKQQRERIAFPDFYLPESNEIVELKSSWTYQGKEQEMKDKFFRYRELGYKPKLILDWRETSV